MGNKDSGAICTNSVVEDGLLGGILADFLYICVGKKWDGIVEMKP